MRKYFALMLVVLLAATATTAFAKATRDVENLSQAPLPGELLNDVPARAPQGFARADTINFGYYQVIGGNYYAVQGETWTWDHGAPDPFEGWYAVDATVNLGAYWRHITSAIWGSDAGNPTPAPLITGTGCVWVGLFQGEAEDLCWEGGLGYGNSWCQRLTSPTLNYDGSGAVDLSLKYWCDTEENFDYGKVVLQVGPNRTNLNESGFSGKIGFTDDTPDVPVIWTDQITNAEFGGGTTARDFQIILEFTSDGGWSDEDGSYTTTWGPWAVDDLSLTNNIGTNVAYNWDASLQNWTSSTCPGNGSYFGVADVGQYIIQDPCVCELAGNVVELHDAFNEHPGSPNGQKEALYSPPADRTTIPNYLDYNEIFADWDMYAELPEPNGVYYRSGWTYYPFVCPSTGEVGWSPRTGRGGWFYAGDQPVCFGTREVATDWGVPADCEQIAYIFELYSSCDAFGTDPCTGVTNFTPLLDNVQIRMTGVPNAPVIAFAEGTQYQDGFGQGLLLSTTDAGNADITYDLSRDEPIPDRLGDSLHVKGPAVVGTNNQWEAKLWFTVARSGPGQSSNATYNQWANDAGVNKGFDIEGGEFSYGLMDSFELGTQVAKNKFNSYFNENDPGYLWGGGDEFSDGNEILPDLAFTPGTRIDYFISGNYICLPNTYYLLPDTAGQFYSELEILPSYRLDGGVAKFPCILYVDAYNRGSQFYIENALNVVLAGASSGDPIPDPAPWDRYDYFDGSSNWNAPLFRNIDGNAGATLPQMLGYRAIIVNNGLFGLGSLEPRDWAGFRDWLTAVACNSNSQLQGFIANGDNISAVAAAGGPAFLTQNLGAIHDCDKYYEEGCPIDEQQGENDEQYCVMLEYAPGGPWAPTVPMDVFGNWCPPQLTYDVIGTTGGGLGNKVYEKVGAGVQASYAQVTHDASADPSNYRTVIDGYSYHHMAKRDLGNLGPDTECPSDSASIVEASLNELREQIKWVLNISDPLNLGLCTDPCGEGVDVPEGYESNGMVNRLYQNHPNPFNPRTSIKFSLAQAGPAKLIIYDVSGRKVKTLVNGHQTAGTHEIVWDGVDDAGNPVASGVFWSQLSTDGFSSNKKMVVLK